MNRPRRVRIRTRARRAAAVLALAALPVACVHVSPIAPGPSPVAGCDRFFADLDTLTDQGGARDAGADPLAGAPYLRSDRFLASFAGEALAPAALGYWLERLRALDARARQAEIANLGHAAVNRRVFSPFPGLDPDAVVSECGRRLVARDLSAPERVGRLKPAVTMPDAYSRWRRVLGVYPVTRLALEQGVAALHRRLRKPFALPVAALRQRGRIERYEPSDAIQLTQETLAGLLHRVSQNPLAIPDPRGDERRQLFETFAPIWEIDTVSSADRMGAIGWHQEGRAAVRVDSPAVYRFVTHTRFHGASLLQLNYLIWFPARPERHWLDLYAGELDGLIWRVTLRPDGTPLAYDSIHPCGCYYQVFPGLGYRVQQPDAAEEPVLSPLPVLPARPGQRLVVRVSPGEHHIQAVHSSSAPISGARRYGWREHDELLAILAPSGVRRSLFGPDGLVAHTQRLERFVLWPSGVPSPGAMRRIGTQAIALIGRRHFDDARLLETLLRPL